MTHSPSKIFGIPSAILAALLTAFASIALVACSNSEPVGFDIDGTAIVHCKDTNTTISPTQIDSFPSIDSIDTHEVVCDTISEYLPLDDSEYPYAGIPRIVIETENLREINDRETEIPAKLQIWGEKTPESEIMELTIRGRGNSSWVSMPKKSYKIEFVNKQVMLGMPKDRDWALIANYADKTLLKNFITYRLSKWLGAEYTPNCEFIELYINNQYLGVYLLTETIKIAKNRLNIIESNDSFLAEFDTHYKGKNQVIFLEELQKPISIHYPKAASSATLNILKEHLDSLNTLIVNNRPEPVTLNKWIDLDSYFLFYWVQEFTENGDGNFATSVFFTWTIGKPLKMGPLWDFDLAYNGHPNVLMQDPEKWFIRDYYWNDHLFKINSFKHNAYSYWKSHRDIFVKTIDSLYTYSERISYAAKNNFKRWSILGDTSNKFHTHAYTTHQEAIDSLKKWITQRTKWIDKSIEASYNE